MPIEYTAVHYRAAHTYTALISVSVSLVDRLMTPARVLSARVDTDSGAGAPHTSDTPALC